MRKFLLFDLDGTITDSGPGIRRCAQYALESFGIHAETVDSLPAPPVHHVEDSVPDSGIGPVEIRLLFMKEMKIILSCRLIVLPCRSGEA